MGRSAVFSRGRRVALDAVRPVLRLPKVAEWEVYARPDTLRKKCRDL